MRFNFAVPELDGDKKAGQGIFHSWDPGAWTAACAGSFGLVDACRFEQTGCEDIVDLLAYIAVEQVWDLGAGN